MNMFAAVLGAVTGAAASLGSPRSPEDAIGGELRGLPKRNERVDDSDTPAIAPLYKYTSDVGAKKRRKKDGLSRRERKALRR